MTHLPLASTIYHEDWWLNAAAYGDYEVAEVLNGGYVVGRRNQGVNRAPGRSEDGGGDVVGEQGASAR